ncbi:MAG TPA: pilus assembly protein N-terminal domain-containing protein [Fimbriiglobus sp.]|nr:pilus assembly protein N-terminal domain-containing protein [Fimbriiglobus sp.]
MHRIQYLRRRALAGLAALAGMTAGTALAQPPAKAPDRPGGPAEVRVDKTTGALIVPLGGAVRFTPATDKLIADVLVANEDILQARYDAANPKTLILTGRQAGATQITVTFADKTRQVYDVVVQPDYELLRQVIRRTVPTATVDVVPGVGNVIILTGFVTRPEDSDTIARIASSAVGGNVQNIINNLQIGGAQHVLIDVVLAQVDRTETRQLGVDFAIGGTDAAFRSSISGLIGGNFTAGGASTQTFSPSANLIFGIVPPQIFGAIQALRSEGLAKFISEPKVITQSGRPAFIRAGGQQAVLGPASGINGPGAILENVGTQLDVLPIVFGNGKIYLEVNPQFRSVNNGRGLTTSFGFTPGFNEQQTRSSVLLESGQTFAIGGLIENEVQSTTSKVPYLGDLPGVGTLFRTVRHQERETELLILVTPRLVDALDCTQVPRRVPGRETRSPDDYELFLEGLMEAPRGQRRVFSGNCKLPAYLCDPTACKYPCIGNVCGSPNANCAGGGCAVPAGGPVVAPMVPVVPVPVGPLGGSAPVPIP